MHEGQPDRVDSAAISSLKNNRCPRGIGPIAPCPCSSVSFLPCRGYLLDPLRGSDWERYSWRPPISRACGIWAHSCKSGWVPATIAGDGKCESERRRYTRRQQSILSRSYGVGYAGQSQREAL